VSDSRLVLFVDLGALLHKIDASSGFF
jgi:hypothetical protein